ncbi:MAG: hypothetical protein ACLRVT_07660 [Oscillospiraceae bacterium]
METVYTIAFWVGLIIPSLSLIFSGLCHAIDCSLDLLDGSGFDGGTDMGFHGILGNILAFFPTSPLSIMAFLLVFGGLKLCAGHFSALGARCFLRRSGAIWWNSYSAPASPGAVRNHRRRILYRKMGHHHAGHHGKRLWRGQLPDQGGRSTFIAMADEPIAQGEEVEVIRCERGRLYVKPAHPFRVNEQKMKGEEHA